MTRDLLLEVDGVRAGYGQGEVLHGVGFTVAEGGLTAVLGPNGAGKSTLLEVVSGFLPATAGHVRLAGLDLLGHGPAEIARCGLYYVTEGGGVFPSLTVGENLRVASARPERDVRAHVADAYAAFPQLEPRRDQRSGTLSGGERRMLALARAFLAQPRVLLLDEPSLGLAPKVIDAVFEAIDTLRAGGAAVVLVEQYVHRALAAADTAIVLERGSVAFSGAPAALGADAMAQRYFSQQTN